MRFMICTTCKATVHINPTGLCLACQKGFTGVPDEDRYVFKEKDLLKNLKQREKDLEDAISKRERYGNA